MIMIEFFLYNILTMFALKKPIYLIYLYIVYEANQM